MGLCLHAASLFASTPPLAASQLTTSGSRSAQGSLCLLHMCRGLARTSVAFNFSRLKPCCDSCHAHSQEIHGSQRRLCVRCRSLRISTRSVASMARLLR